MNDSGVLWLVTLISYDTNIPENSTRLLEAEAEVEVRVGKDIFFSDICSISATISRITVDTIDPLTPDNV